MVVIQATKEGFIKNNNSMTKVIKTNQFYKCLILEDLDGEVWKDVKDYEGLYMVSNLGRVKGLKRFVGGKGDLKRCLQEMILKQYVNKYGYCQLMLFKNSIGKTLRVNRIVALSYIENPQSKKEVNHLNGLKIDNRLENLQWATPSENVIHAYKKGLKKIKNGEESSNSKLKDFQVRLIRSKLRNGVPTKGIAKEFAISLSAVHLIRHRKTWGHLD